jgi:S-layer protein (TIGR01567 family)
MKTIFALAVAALLLALSAHAAERLDIRSEVAGTINGVSNLAYDSFTWHPQNFPGFYYDPKKDIGTEELKVSVTDENDLSGDVPFGIVYTTKASQSSFRQSELGSYNVIGFLGERYFAGYFNDTGLDQWMQIPLIRSDDPNSLEKGQLQKILMDDNSEIVVTQNEPLALQEGYQLGFRDIDIRSGRVDLELKKDGVVVDSSTAYPSKDDATYSDKTYTYKKDLSGQRGLVTIAVYIKNAYNDTENTAITVGGIWQISEESTAVKAGAKFGKMSVSEVDGVAGIITLNNAGQPIALQKNSDVPLMGDIHLRTADSDALRLYLYRQVTEPGAYDIRSSIAGTIAENDNLDDGSFTWNPQNFAGFFYDADRDLGTETLTATLTEDNRLSGDSPYGISYQTAAQLAELQFQDWGKYLIIGFLGEPYFAGYRQADDMGQDMLYRESIDDNSLVSEQIEKILLDSSGKVVLAKGDFLDLDEGYRLLLKGVDESGRAFLELSRDGVTVNSRIIAPGNEYATTADKTYWYRTNVGAQNGLVTIAVHFKDAVSDGITSQAIVDGIWQISEKPVSVAPDKPFGKMLVASVDASSGVITMDNKDSALMLIKNRDLSLFPEIGLRTADNDSLRFFIYRQEKI